MNVVIEEIISEYPIVITEEVVQLKIADATSYFDIVEVVDTDFIGKNGYVPVVDEASGKLVLQEQQSVSGGGIPDAPNNSNAYVRSGLSWVIGYAKSAIDSLLSGKFNNPIGNSTQYLDGSGTPTTFPTIPNISGLATTTYVDDQDALKVDKVSGKSLILDSEITRLATVTNFDNSGNVSALSNKVDKVAGSRLITSYESTVLGNTSGTNTGDETATSIATIHHGTNEKTTLVDGDEISGQNSASAFSLIRFTCLNLYNYLKSKFDSVYTTQSWVTAQGFITNVISSLGFTPENTSNKGVANGYVPLNSSTKIDTTYLPDSILGQLLYGGIVNATTVVATLTANAKSKLGTSSASITLTNNTNAITGYIANEGLYYICSTAGTFAGISFDVGDWLLSVGSAWSKIDNTDAISSFNSRTGAIVLTIADVTTALTFTPANKAGDTFTGAVTVPSIIVSGETASTIASFDGSKNIKSLSTATYPSLAELAFLKGITSGIQTQIDAKLNSASPSFTGLITGNGGTKITSGVGLIDISQTWNNVLAIITGIKMNIADSASSSSSLLMDLQVGGVSKFNVDKNGNISFAGLIKQDINYPSGASRGLIVRANGSSFTTSSFILRLDNAANGNIVTNTSNDFNQLDMLSTGFNPSSGNAAFNFINCGSIINQTGTASGITRGLYINPTLTSAYDFRAIEITGGKIVVPSTIITPGTTGAQTINKISGKVNAAAGTTSLVVTNNLVTASSIVMCQLGTNDATARIISVVEGAGSFTINYIAPTAEIVIKFKVIN